MEAVEEVQDEARGFGVLSCAEDKCEMNKQRIESHCCSCGKVEKVNIRIVNYDNNGIYHVCNKCLKAYKLKELKKDG